MSNQIDVKETVRELAKYYSMKQKGRPVVASDAFHDVFYRFNWMSA